jgi:serine phosphatase RsbU (regulator of sigma subunit)
MSVNQSWPENGFAISRAAIRLALVSQPDEVVSEIGALVSEAVGTSSVAIATSAGGLEAELVVISGASTPAVATSRRLPISAHHPLVHTLRDGVTRMFGSVESLLAEYPELETRARMSGDRSWAHLGVRLNESILGAVGLGFETERVFTAEDERLFSEFAYLCLASIERANRYEQEALARQRAEKLVHQSSGLVATAIAVNRATNPREVLESLIRSTEKTVPGSFGLAAYWRDDEPEPAVTLGASDRRPPTEEHVHWVRHHLKRDTTTLVIADNRLSTAPEDWSDAEAVALVPMVAGGNRLGALALLLDKADVTDEDMSLFSAMASICSQAFARSKLQERQQHMAETLQRTLLSHDLPSIPGVEIAARYQPSYDEMEIGGDWFQALSLSETKVAFAVGDVVGRGFQAASSMGQLRSALAGAAINRPSPIQVLRTLDVAAKMIPGGLYTTVAYGLLDPSTGLLRYSCAGHPPPLLIGSSGEVRFLRHGRGAPLGVDAMPREGEGRVTLGPGDQVIFYTDGLIERRSESIDEGLQRLVDAATDAARLGLDAGADELLATMLDPSQSAPDDVTLLWFEVKGE